MNIDPNGDKWWEFWKWNWAKILAVGIPVMFLVGTAALAVSAFGGPIAAAIGGIGFVLGFSVSAIAQGNEFNLGQALYDGLWGAIGTFVAATGIGAFGSIAFGALMGGLQSLGSDILFNNGKINSEKLVYSMIGGAVAGLFAGAGAKGSILDAKVSWKIMNNTIANNTIKSIEVTTARYLAAITKVWIAAGLYIFGFINGQAIQSGG